MTCSVYHLYSVCIILKSFIVTCNNNCHCWSMGGSIIIIIVNNYQQVVHREYVNFCKFDPYTLLYWRHARY